MAYKTGLGQVPGMGEMNVYQDLNNSTKSLAELVSYTRTKKKRNPFALLLERIGLIKKKRSTVKTAYDFLQDDSLSLLQKDFLAAANRFEDIMDDLEFEDWLNAYALFKQATIGDCNILKPSGLFKRRLFKYTAWKARIGLSTDDAAIRYIKFVKYLDEKQVNPVAAVRPNYNNSQFPSLNGFKKKREDYERKLAKNEKPVHFQEGPKIPDEASDVNTSILRPTNNPRRLLEEPPPKFNEKNLTYRYSSATGPLSKERASLKLQMFLEAPTNASEHGMAFKDFENPESDYEDIDLEENLGQLSSTEVRRHHLIKRQSRQTSKASLKLNRRRAGSAFGVHSSRASSTIRQKYLASEAEYRRFTFMKMNSTVISSTISHNSFVRPDYEYRGPSLEVMVQQGRLNGDKLMATSQLNIKKDTDERYKAVLAIVHRLCVEHQREIENNPANASGDDFAAKNFLNIPLDRFLFRLVRYLDRWFEDPPGINSAGARSMLITQIYLQRLRHNMVGFMMTKFNVFKLLSVCMLLAAKYCEDCIIANAYWAQVAGISVEELNKVEEVFCNVTHFDLYVKGEELEKVCNRYDLWINRDPNHIPASQI